MSTIQDVSKRLTENKSKKEKLLSKRSLGSDTRSGFDVKEYKKVTEEEKLLLEEYMKF